VGVAGRVGGQVIVSAGPATVGGRATGRTTGSWPLSVRVGRRVLEIVRTCWVRVTRGVAGRGVDVLGRDL